MMLAFVASAPAVEPGHPTILNVLAAFVAINTLMYVCLAMLKMLPRIHVPKALQRPYSRSETRSIFPKKAP